MRIAVNGFDINLYYLEKWKCGTWSLAKSYAYCIASVRDDMYRDIDTPLKKAERKARKIELRILQSELIRDYMLMNGYVLDHNSEIQEYEKIRSSKSHCDENS